MILHFLDSAAVALVLCWLITWNSRFWSDNSFGGRVLAGIALGIVAVIGMLDPVTLAPGIIYDVRLIIINAATLFGGPITGFVTGCIASAYRLSIGGVGAPTGVASIALAFSAGLLFRHIIKREWIRSKSISYFSMGLLTHVALLILTQFTLNTSEFQSLEYFASELLFLPLVTLLLCLLMQNQKKRVAIQQQVKSALARLSAISEAIPDLLLVLDENGQYLEVFSANEELLTMPKEKLIGNSLHSVLPKEQADFFVAWIRSVIKDRNTKTIEYEMDTPAGKLQFEARARFLGDPSSGRNSVVLLTRDITHRKTLEHEVHALAYYDPLTQLPNRRHLMEHLEGLEQFNVKGKNIGALLHIDLDDFKFINEIHGHATGDTLLKELVFRLQETIHAKYYLARIGGDAFAILIEDLHQESANAKQLAKEFSLEILRKIKEPFNIGSNRISLSGSIGIVMLGNNYPLHELMVWAELALYAAKDEGKDASRFFDPTLQETISQRVKLENEIRVALITNQFQIFYQSQVDSRSKMIGVEALLRWNHPERGLIPPVEFLPIAEHAGIMSEIDRWVFQRVCKEMGELLTKSNNPNLTVSINIGGSLLGQVDLFEQLTSIAERLNVDPHRIQIEVTETTLVKNLESSKTQMLKLKNMGFKFSLDDFGTGYSSFNYLRQFPIDEVKIDQSFVHGLPNDHESLAIIKSVVTLAPTFGFTVIAEGIENAEQEKCLIDNGCTHFQGFFYSTPKPLEALFD